MKRTPEGTAREDLSSAGPRLSRRPRTVITGGAGFVGSNLAARLAGEGHEVVLLDNLTRASVVQNWYWLQEQFGDRVRLVQGDVRDAELVRRLITGVQHVFHLAAQVAVTTSLQSPFDDFDVNARGTLNVLEAVRAQRRPPTVLFTSTNKVYGALNDVALVRRRTRYTPHDGSLQCFGINESRPLDFHSPYGCSKGAADQYVLDYARTFGIPAAVFRMSCIYGQRQFGTEDQGWVAHFVLEAQRGEALTVFGDGRQVRDVLHVDDLMDAMCHMIHQPDRLVGRAFNVGGGPGNTLSLVELLAELEQRLHRACRVNFADWRRGDQRYYVSDCRRLEARTGWKPRISVDQGIERLIGWGVDLLKAEPLHRAVL